MRSHVRPFASLLLAGASASFVLVACSPEVRTFPGTGGGGAAAASSSATGGSSSESSASGTASSSAAGTGGSGGSGGCTADVDCPDDLDPCAHPACDAGVCTKVLDGAIACDDGLSCTEGDVCTGGICTGTTVTCTGSTCLDGVCDEAAGGCTLVPSVFGASCEDVCNPGATCDGNGACDSPTPTDCSMLDGVCKKGVCNLPNGCEAQPMPDFTPCDDGNACTLNTICQGGSCFAQTVIMTCGVKDGCCPMGCVNDADCSPPVLYWQPGVQQNVDPAALVGWTQCYSGTYDQGGVSLSTILQQCDKPKLLMACRPVMSPTYTLLAMAPRADVLFDCAQDKTCTKQSNGVGWYYATDWSWGFAPGGVAVNRFSCDYDDGMQMLPLQAQRMCWHTNTGNLSAGYRCGANSIGAGWQRVVYEAN